MWRGTRATWGALTLVVLLCLALSLLPTSAPVAGLREVSLSLDSLSPPQQRLLEAALRNAHKLALHDPRIREELENALNAMESQDLEHLSETLLALEAVLREESTRTGSEVRKVLSEASKQILGISKSPVDRPVVDVVPPAGEPEGQEPTVRVYDPGYAKAIRDVATPATPSLDSAPTARLGTTRSYDDSWSNASLRASEALRRGAIPPRYRKLIRDYFLHAEQ